MAARCPDGGSLAFEMHAILLQTSAFISGLACVGVERVGIEIRIVGHKLDRGRSLDDRMAPLANANLPSCWPYRRSNIALAGGDVA